MSDAKNRPKLWMCQNADCGFSFVGSVKQIMQKLGVSKKPFTCKCGSLFQTTDDLVAMAKASE